MIALICRARRRGNPLPTEIPFTRPLFYRSWLPADARDDFFEFHTVRAVINNITERFSVKLFHANSSSSVSRFANSFSARGLRRANSAVIRASKWPVVARRG